MGRFEIVQAVINNMKLILKKDGFLTDAGNCVYEWLERPLGDDEIPCIIVRDPKSSSHANSYSSTHTLNIEIDVIISDTKITNTKSLKNHISDVIKAFGTTCKTINQVGEYKESEIIADFKGRTYATARLEFTITYHTPKWEH